MYYQTTKIEPITENLKNLIKFKRGDGVVFRVFINAKQILHQLFHVVKYVYCIKFLFNLYFNNFFTDLILSKSIHLFCSFINRTMSAENFFLLFCKAHNSSGDGPISFHKTTF